LGGGLTAFDPVVSPASDLLIVGIAEVFHRRAVRSKPISGDCLRRPMPLQRLLHEAQRCVLIAGFGDVAFEDLPFVIHGPPQIDHLAIQLHVHLVEMPAPVTQAPHVRHPLPPDVAGKHRAEPVPPHPHGLVADVDAALEQQVLDVPQRQRETHVHHHDQADHLG
jgi:hypothetical protein